MKRRIESLDNNKARNITAHLTHIMQLKRHLYRAIQLTGLNQTQRINSPFRRIQQYATENNSKKNGTSLNQPDLRLSGFNNLG